MSGVAIIGSLFRRDWVSGAIGAAVIALALAFVFQPTAMAQANVQGQWQTLQTQMPINPIHITLMHNGKVLVVSGSGNLPSDTTYLAGVWDPATQTITTQPVPWDMFCNGMVELPDGRPFIVSGTIQYDPFLGDPRSGIYDLATGTFVQLQSMAHGRWYPSVTTLGDGRIMVFSGLDENSNTNNTVEIYTVGSGWSTPTQAPFTPPLYPRMHVLPNGLVFNSGSQTTSYFFNPSTQTWTTGPTTNYSGVRTYGSSVLLPLSPSNNYKPVVMIMGGGSPATATTELIDLSQSSPKWVYGPSMSEARIEMDATILPNGDVLALNGSLNDEDATTEALNADLYNPTTNTFSSAGQETYARLYHSGSLLLPDGTIMVVGGNPARGTYEPHVEIYSPPYLFNSNGTLATRPTITSVASGLIGYGSTFQIQTPNASSISSVVLIRPGSPTHAFDMDQRMVSLSFTAGSGVLTATAPPNGNIAPPGYYLLFILNSSGVPSVAQFVQLSANPTDTPPTGIITSPTNNPTISPGQSVTFSGSGTSTDSTIASYSWVFPGGTPSTSSLANPGPVTYSTAGTYPASLTVTDALGVTDPNPPTQTITVSTGFSLSPSPTSQIVEPGNSAQYYSIVTPNGQFTGTVTLSVSGLPAGATASFNPPTITGSGSSILTVNTSSSTPLGSSTLTVTGTSGSIVQTTTVTLTLSNSVPTSSAISIDFVGGGTPMATTEIAGVVQETNWNNAGGASDSSGLSLADSTGAATGVKVSWTSDDIWQEGITDTPGNMRMMNGYLDNGYQDTTTVSVTGLPSNPNGYAVYVYANGGTSGGSNTGIYQISGTGITTQSISLTYTSDFNGTFTPANGSVGNYVVFTLPNVPGFSLSGIPSTASSGYERAPVNGIQIVPLGSPSPDFTISATPTTNSASPGGSASYTVAIGATNGFTGSVSLAASGLPTGSTYSFTPPSITESGSSTLTITTAGSTPLGNSTVTVAATSGSLAHNATVTLSVATPDFTLTPSPTAATITPGNNATYTLTVAPLNGFSSAVSFTINGLPSGATASFNPTSITMSGSSTLTIVTASSTPIGTSTLSITASTSEEQAHTTTATLNVVSASALYNPISIDFVGGDVSMASTETAGVVAETNWNNATGASNSTPLGLVDSTGAVSGASVTWKSDDVWQQPITDAAGNVRMMRGYLDNGYQDTSTITVSGLPLAPYGYAVYVYAGGSISSGSDTGIYQISGSGITTTSISLTYSSQFNGTFSQADNSIGNYVMFTIPDVTGFTLQAIPSTATSGYERAPVNGIQIVPLGPPNPDFTISASPSSTSVAPGNSTPYTVTLGVLNGFSGAVNLSVSGLPTGATYSFNPASVTSAGTSTLTVTAGTSTPNGTSTLTITGTSGTLTHSATVSLTVATPDFTIAASPGTATVAPGGNIPYTVTVGAVSGFSGSVNLSVSGLPTGATYSFNPSSITGSGTSTLTVTTIASTPTGNSTVTITGTSGSLTHSATATLTVQTSAFSGDVISVDFVGTDVPMANTETAGVVAKTNWNDAEGAYNAGFSDLVDATGTSTGTSIAWSSDDVWETSITDSAGNNRMMKGYLDNGYADTTTITVTSLPSDPNGYTVYVYANGGTTGTNAGLYQISGTGITTTTVGLTYNANFNGTFTQANSSVGNYVVFTIPSVSGFTISAIPSTASTGYERAPVNGIQIVGR